MGPTVSIIMGSDSDLKIMKLAAGILESFDVSFEIKIVSAHRTAELMVEFAKKARERGIKVIIAGAGGVPLAVTEGDLMKTFMFTMMLFGGIGILGYAAKE